MIYVMPDTCVWFSLMEDVDLRSPVQSLERLVNSGEIVILTTEEIQREFNDPDSRKVQHGRTERKVIEDFIKRNINNKDEDAQIICNMLAKNTDFYVRSESIAEAKTHAEAEASPHFSATRIARAFENL